MSARPHPSPSLTLGYVIAMHVVRSTLIAVRLPHKVLRHPSTPRKSSMLDAKRATEAALDIPLLTWLRTRDDP